jgi:hypothetical protein
VPTSSQVVKNAKANPASAQVQDGDIHLRRSCSAGATTCHPVVPPTGSVQRDGTNGTVTSARSLPANAGLELPRDRHCGDLPGPPELSAVNPDAVHDHGQPTRSCDDRLLHPTMPGNLHRPGFKLGPFGRTHQRGLGCFVEYHSHHLVSTP